MANSRRHDLHPDIGFTASPIVPLSSTERHGESQAERLRRRAAFLRDLADARDLRARVRPRHTRLTRVREALRRATYHAF